MVRGNRPQWSDAFGHRLSRRRALQASLGAGALAAGLHGRGFPAALPDEAGDDLDVEDPTREKRLGEDLAHQIAGAEELRAALRVVDRES